MLGDMQDPIDGAIQMVMAAEALFARPVTRREVAACHSATPELTRFYDTLGGGKKSRHAALQGLLVRASVERPDRLRRLGPANRTAVWTTQPVAVRSGADSHASARVAVKADLTLEEHAALKRLADERQLAVAGLIRMLVRLAAGLPQTGG